MMEAESGGRGDAVLLVWEMEEAAADLKMNSTLFVPEQSISGGGVGVGGGKNT